MKIRKHAQLKLIYVNFTELLCDTSIGVARICSYKIHVYPLYAAIKEHLINKHFIMNEAET